VLEHLAMVGYHISAAGHERSPRLRQHTTDAARLRHTLAKSDGYDVVQDCSAGAIGLTVQTCRVPDLWEETTSIGTLRSDDLTRDGVVFRYNHYLYRTSGVHLSNGGMGTVYELERRDDESGAIEKIVG
jgi:hypothetical protein